MMINMNSMDENNSKKFNQNELKLKKFFIKNVHLIEKSIYQHNDNNHDSNNSNNKQNDLNKNKVIKYNKVILKYYKKLINTTMRFFTIVIQHNVSYSNPAIIMLYIVNLSYIGLLDTTKKCSHGYNYIRLSVYFAIVLITNANCLKFNKKSIK